MTASYSLASGGIEQYRAISSNIEAAREMIDWSVRAKQRRDLRQRLTVLALVIFFLVAVAAIVIR